MAGPHDDDPYYNVALIFAAFMCSRCGECLIGDDQTGETYGLGDDWYHQFGEFAKRIGWHAETIIAHDGSEDWMMLCPACTVREHGDELDASA